MSFRRFNDECEQSVKLSVEDCRARDSAESWWSGTIMIARPDSSAFQRPSSETPVCAFSFTQSRILHQGIELVGELTEILSRCTMASDPPSSDRTVFGSAIQFSQDGCSSHTESLDATDVPMILEDDGLADQGSRQNSTMNQQSAMLYTPSPDMGLNISKPAEDAAPTPSKYDTLTKGLTSLQSDHVRMIRQLHRHMLLTSASTSASSMPATTSSTSEYSILPSMAAHTVSNPPLTAAQVAEATEFSRSTIQEHIRLLQQYNQIRDIGQGLIGMVAERKKARVRDCQEDFGITDGD
jgi:Swi5